MPSPNQNGDGPDLHPAVQGPKTPSVVRFQIESLQRAVRDQGKILDRWDATVAELLTAFPAFAKHFSSARADRKQGVEIVRSLVQSLVTRTRDLEKTSENAEQKAKLKAEILANMSHEIRTPMNGVFGMVNLVLDTNLDHKQRDYIETIRASTESLLNILNDVLDYSKLSSEQLSLEPRNFDTGRLLEDVIRTFSANAEEKNLKLNSFIGPGVPSFLRGDDLRLRQVLSNLVGNAIKFTGSGSVELGVSFMNQTENDAVWLHFQINDTGIGIPEERIDELFCPFAQADSSTARRFGGTGLGLAISKNIVDLMGGRIWVESQTGTGSTFQFTVPLEPAAEKPAEVSSSDPANRVGSPFEEDAGFGDSRISDGVDSGTPPPRILLAEDNDVNQKVGQLTLERLGYAVDLASNGAEAVELAKTNAYDIICMDLQMPKMDGIEACQKIRNLGNHSADARILAMTGHAFSEDRTRCLENGMDAFITKPFDLVELRSTLESMIPGEKPELETEPESGAGQDDFVALSA